MIPTNISFGSLVSLVYAVRAMAYANTYKGFHGRVLFDKFSCEYGSNREFLDLVGPMYNKYIVQE